MRDERERETRRPGEDDNGDTTAGFFYNCLWYMAGLTGSATGSLLIGGSSPHFGCHDPGSGMCVD